MRRLFAFLAIWTLALGARVAVIAQGVAPDEISKIERYFRSLGNVVVRAERVEEIAKRFKGNLGLVFAARMLSIDEIYVLRVENGVLKVEVVSGGEVHELFTKRVERGVFETFKEGFEGMKGSEAPREPVKIGKWREGIVYSRGDVVKSDGKLYRCEKTHFSTEGNKPPSPFWGEIERKMVVGYFTSWGVATKAFRAVDIDGSVVTHVHFAFANVAESGECIVGDERLDLGMRDDGTCRWDGNFADLEKLKERYPSIRVVISVGGWNWSGNFSAVAADPQKRKRFVKSCVERFILGNFGKCGTHPIFDGIDIDWEFPVSGGKRPGREEDRENYLLLVKELRGALDELERETGKHYTLSIAGGSSADFIFRNTKLSEMAKYLDYIVVMTYDFHGPWSRSGFNANLYPYPEDPVSSELSVDSVIENYIRAGVPREKLLLGIPFYGRSWEAKGLGMMGKIGPGTIEGGVLDYSDIRARFERRMRKHFHPIAQAVWLEDGRVFISYDDPFTVSLKALYALEEGLGGVAIWELSGDVRGVPAPEGSLLRAIGDVFVVK